MGMALFPPPHSANKNTHIHINLGREYNQPSAPQGHSPFSPKAQAMMTVWSQETLSLDLWAENTDMQASCNGIILFSLLIG